MTTKINMLAIDLAKGSFQLCAVGPDGAVLSSQSGADPAGAARRPRRALIRAMAPR